MQYYPGSMSQKYIEPLPTDELLSCADRTEDAALGLRDNQLTQKLRYEQCLNQLGNRVQEWITTFLEDEARFEQSEAGQVEALVLQILMQELSNGLNYEQVAIALADSADGSSATFTIRQIQTQTSPIPRFLCNFDAARSIQLQAKQTLTQPDLQTLQQQAPEAIWSLTVGQTLMGYLLVCSEACDFESLTSTATRSLKSQFIERGIQIATIALRQIQQVQLLRQQQRQLATYTRELEQANRLKSEFLANTSHEIRTPLSSILGFTHLLREQSFNPAKPRHQEYLNIILSSGQHLLALINDILDLSKIEADQLDLHWEPIEIREVCQTALTLVREKANDKGLTLHLEVAPEVTTIVADSLRLKQMLFNLLSNGLKFTIEGSVGLQVSATASTVEFAVWDTGSGIAPEQQKLLFRPYSQINNGVVQSNEGTGLGLALTQKLAELHGGSVAVESEVYQGSRFTISLPIAPPEPMLETLATMPGSIAESIIADSALLQAPSQSEVTKSMSNRLLLVEDDRHNAKLMLTYLSKRGYELTWAQDGQEMWQALARDLPALILMDIHLPEVDGLTLIRQLRSQTRFETIPVIAQTAMAMQGDRQLCLEAGATDYVTKPIDLEILMATIGQYVCICDL
jgi:signal transduction histidine kinase/CheY-like chemotaxis protein